MFEKATEGLTHQVLLCTSRSDRRVGSLSLVCRSTLDYRLSFILDYYSRSCFQTRSVSLYVFEHHWPICYGRLDGYLKQTLVELSSQKSTRAERNPAAP